jgi:hypothetical protein
VRSVLQFDCPDREALLNLHNTWLSDHEIALARTTAFVGSDAACSDLLDALDRQVVLAIEIWRSFQ